MLPTRYEIIFTCFIIFSCLLESCFSLQCHSCNVTTSAKYGNDPCKGISTIVKCQDPAMCMSLTYSIDDHNLKTHQYATIKSCYPKMNGMECENFLKNVKNLYPISTKIDFKEDCFVCDADRCNERSSSTQTFPALVISVLSYLFVRYF